MFKENGAKGTNFSSEGFHSAKRQRVTFKSSSNCLKNYRERRSTAIEWVGHKYVDGRQIIFKSDKVHSKAQFKS